MYRLKPAYENNKLERIHYVKTLLRAVSYGLTGSGRLSVAAPGKFTPEQIAAMKSYGFNELNGDWSLGMSDTILFDKNDARLRPESETQIQSMASRLAKTGLNHARMDGHTDNYGEASYNEALSLKRANAVADARAKGANIPRSNLTTRD